MAAHSGGVDWTSVIKPLLNSGSLSKNDLNNLTKTILKWWVNEYKSKSARFFRVEKENYSEFCVWKLCSRTY